MALAVSSVLSLSAVLTYQVASNNQGDASLRRVQAQALDAAEGGLNRAYQAVQEVTSASQLPCTLGESLVTQPSPSSYSATLNYYANFPPSGAALTCTPGQGVSSTPQALEIISTGTNDTTNEFMEALVKLTLASTTASVFDQAMFSNQTMAGANNATVDGNVGNDANIYTNGNEVCANNMVVQGSVTVEGTFSGANNCTIDGNLAAVGNIAMANNTYIGGNATSSGSGGCATQGSISMANSAVVQKNALAYCTITLLNNSTVKGNQYPNDATVAGPSPETFPSIPEPITGSSAAASWAAAGYTNQITDNNCLPAGVYQDIANMAATNPVPAPTVIMTTCVLAWANNSSNSLSQNLAIFSTGGFTMANNTSWQSVNSTTHTLYLIVPSSVGSTTTQCVAGQPGITFANNTSFANTLDVLDYTPCTITVANNSTGVGQVYGGNIVAANNFTSHYYPVPAVPGSSGGGANASATTIAVVYERQISSLAQA
ncbi:MAG TPA: hypothetical protein VMV14_01330 [Acidimicrobiales bacterium]|nr:hypothetical protein [Acidimicrobiales bacterium]